MKSNVLPMPGRIKPGEELVSGESWFTELPRALPSNSYSFSFDDAELNTETVEKMLLDSDVHAGLMLVCLMVLSEKILITPAVTAAKVDAEEAGKPAQPTLKIPTTNKPNVNLQPESNPATKEEQVILAAEIAEFCEQQLKNVKNLSSKLYEVLFEGMAHGNKVAELIINTAERGKYKGKWILSDIKPKPRESVMFVVDEYMNQLGILGARRNQPLPFTAIVNKDDIITREKFLFFSYRPQDLDPRGTSALKAAKKGWSLKQRGWPEYLLFVMVCAIPGILATLGQGNDREQVLYEDDGFTAKKDASGEILKVSAAQFVLNILSKMRNHQIGVLPTGTEVTLLEANSKGEVFDGFFNHTGKEITRAILLQELATRDAQHQTKGSTGTQMRVIDLLVFWLRDVFADAIRHDILHTLVKYNFGDDAALELLPGVNLGDTEARDWARDANSVAALANIVSESQLDQLFTQIGLKPATAEEKEERKQRKEDMHKSLTKKDDDDEEEDTRESEDAGGNE